MTITTEELASIRAIAEADKNGADGKAPAIYNNMNTTR